MDYINNADSVRVVAASKADMSRASGCNIFKECIFSLNMNINSGT